MKLHRPRRESGAADFGDAGRSHEDSLAAPGPSLGETLMRKSAPVICVLVALTVAGTAKAVAPIYDSTGNPRFNAPSDTTPLRYNDNAPFFSSQSGVPDRPAGDTSRIQYDDVPVNAAGAASVNVSSVRFDIVQKAGAPAVTVSGFWSPMAVDAATAGGPGDGPNDDPNAANPLGVPVPILANSTASDRVVSVTFANPFNTGPLNTTQDPGGLEFFNVGLSFDNTSPLNGWEVADNINNLDLLWDYKNNTDINEFTFGNDANGDPIYGVMAVQVLGTVVPEPGMIGLAIGGAGLLLRRRARRLVAM